MRPTLLLALALACRKDDPTDDDGAPTDTGTPAPTAPTIPTLTTPTEPLPACAPALRITPDGAAADPLDVLQLVASGGTGDYVWKVGAGGAGSVSRFGTYLAPAEPTVDTVVLTDRGCDGVAEATIRVGQPFEVLPGTATVLPGTAFTFEVVGGTGSHSCALVASDSGAALDGCDYEAGSAPGLDRVRVTDDGTGERVEATITVDPDATWRVWGEGGWTLPVDHPFAAKAEGGSGILELTVLGGPFTATDGSLVADRTGVGTVRVRDRFAGFEATVGVTGVEPYVPPSTWFGTQSLQGRALALGDLDGDGYDDAALGVAELHTGALTSGAVAVWQGGRDGLGPAPAWSWHGVSSDQGVGRALAHADLDGDGIRDLVVGVDGDDYGIVNVGTLQLFRGVAGGTFETEPFRLLRGVYSSDRFGSAVAVCDVDGDGVDDVAATAWAHESRVGTTYPSDTGALMVFRGVRVGNGVEYPDAPTTTRYGAAWSAGAWTGMASAQLGFLGLAGGDIDDDGDCDLAVATQGDGVFGAPDSYGFVQVFEGLPSGQGTLSDRPVRQYANVTDTNANFGRDLAMDDVDGDGRDDLLVGAWAWDGPRGGSSGGAFLFLSASWDGRDPTVPVEPDEADWWVTGRQGSDYTGLDIGLADVDGDGAPDVIVGSPRGETATGVANAGVARVYAATDVLATLGADAVDATPWLEVAGTVAEEFFAQAVDVVGDTDGDGEVELLVLSGRSDVDGYDRPRAYEARATEPPRELELPGEPAGHDHGRAAALVDVDGDGERDLVVGSPQDLDPTRGLYTGQLDTFAGDGDLGFASSSSPLDATWGDFGSSDRLGFALAALDFDGDGREDLAVAARNDSRPTTFGASYVNPTDCPGSVSGSGSVLVYLGTPSGLATTPAFVFYGPDASANVRILSGPLDHDGDGTDDLLVAGRDWRVEGGFSILRGRPANPAGTTVICTADTWFGRLSGDVFGQSATAVPDLDGDGCDEAAVGAPREDLGWTDQGVLRVFWGYGPSCATATPRVTSLAIDLASSAVGEALAAGDLDGDGAADLAITSVDWRVASTRMGGVWVVPGSWIRSLPSQSTPVGVLPDPTTLHPLFPPDGHYGINGPTRSARFGVSVAVVRDPVVGRDVVAVGMPDGDAGGVRFAGGVMVYRWTDDTGDGLPGLDPVPWRVIGGETALPGGAFGETLSAARSGARGALLVGAPLSSVGGLQQGAAWVAPVERP
jgi:hypothetical protein